MGIDHDAFNQATKGLDLISRGLILLTRFLITLLIVATAGTAAAQNSTQPDQILHAGANEFGVWGGISLHASTLIGGTPNARFGNLTFRYGRVLAANKKVAFEWTIDASPVAILNVKPFTFTHTTSGNTYAAGASPLGLKFNIRPQRRVQPFVSASGGFLYFQKPVPAPAAERFNFTFDFGGGVQIVNTSRRAFMIGYKFQHISNGERSRVNPGIDVHVIYAGFSIFR